MSDAAEKIRAMFDKAAVDALGKQLGKPEGTAHATVTVTDDTIDVLIEFDPPSYLPMREQPPPRIPDLCPDEHDPENYGGGSDDGPDIDL